MVSQNILKVESGIIIKSILERKDGIVTLLETTLCMQLKLKSGIK